MEDIIDYNINSTLNLKLKFKALNLEIISCVLNVPEMLQFKWVMKGQVVLFVFYLHGHQSVHSRVLRNHWNDQQSLDLSSLLYPVMKYSGCLIISHLLF